MPFSKKIGGGGMGCLQGRGYAPRPECCLKFLPDDIPTILRRSSDSGAKRALPSSLNHPNICTIYDIGEFDARSFIAMELLKANPESIASNSRCS